LGLTKTISNTIKRKNK